MFDIGWTEMLVVACVAILVVGPKDLPGMLRTFGKSISKIRGMAGDFQRQFSDALKEADLDEVANLRETAKAMNPLSDIEASVKDLGKGMKLESDDDDVADPIGIKAEIEPTNKPVKKKPHGLKTAEKSITKPVAKKPARKVPVKKAVKPATSKPAAKTAAKKAPNQSSKSA